MLIVWQKFFVCVSFSGSGGGEGQWVDPEGKKAQPWIDHKTVTPETDLRRDQRGRGNTLRMSGEASRSGRRLS